MLLADLSSVRLVEKVEVAGSPVTLPCHHNQPHLTKLEWRCRGCFSISNTKESRSVALSHDVGVTEEKGLEIAAVINCRQNGAAMTSFAPVAE